MKISGIFQDELAQSMEADLLKNASASPHTSIVTTSHGEKLLRQAEEILRSHGLNKQAAQVSEILAKLAQKVPVRRNVQQLPAIKDLMHAGLTQRDLTEFSKGNPLAKARFNLVLRKLGYSDHDMGRFLGFNNVMSEDDAKKILDPNRAFGKIEEWIQHPSAPVGMGDIVQIKPVSQEMPSHKKPGEELAFTSIARNMTKKKVDPHTKGLTSKKQLQNIMDHGTVFNLDDDGFAMDEFVMPSSVEDHELNFEDMPPEFASILNQHRGSQMTDDPDDWILDHDVGAASDGGEMLEDFEDERDA